MDKKESLIVSACLLGAFLLSFSMLKAMYHQMASVTDNREAPLLESHIVSFSDGHGDTVESQSLYRTFKYENVIHFSQSQREPVNPPPREPQLDISNLESSDDWKLYIQNLQNSDSEEQGHFTACELKHLYHAVDRRVERSAAKVRPAPLDFPLECGACKLGVTLLQTLIAQHKSKEEIKLKLISFCVILKIEDDNVCTGIVSLFQTEVLYVFDQLALDPSQVCGFFLGDECSDVYNPFEMWNVTLPSTPKPPVVQPKPPKEGAPKLRVLQLADIHIDFEYKPGTNADCNEPVCCRKEDGPVKVPAGKWGSYLDCDTPQETFEHMLQHIASTEQIDYIIWLGDLPGHNVWDQTREDQIYVEKYLTEILLKYFPDKKIYAALGNHESSPVNSFPPPFVEGNMSISWLYETLVTNWTVWLPESTKHTINWGAYYTVLLEPGFRLVSLNMNYCNNENWWLLLNMTDPAQELQWLITVLQSAEDNHEKVHILGHIPPGSGDCVKAWSWNYYEIVNRYESTIAAQFFGHTHKDSFIIFHDEEDPSRPVNTAYIGPSVTPYQGLNPAYRIYEFDGFYPESTFAVLDHINYIANLSEANQPGQSPVWKKEYSAKEQYNMKSMFPADWQILYNRLKEDSSLFNTFHKFYYKSHPPKTPCGHHCKRSLLCSLEQGRSHDPTQCLDLNVTVEATPNSGLC